MLSYLQYLSEYFGPMRLFGFTSSRAVLAALTAFVLMMVVMPRLIRWLQVKKKFGEQGAKGDGAIIVDTMRKAKAGTPTMGGLGYFTRGHHHHHFVVRPAVRQNLATLGRHAELWFLGIYGRPHQSVQGRQRYVHSL